MKFIKAVQRFLFPARPGKSKYVGGHRIAVEELDVYIPASACPHEHPES